VEELAGPQVGSPVYGLELGKVVGRRLGPVRMMLMLLLVLLLVLLC